MILEIDLGKYSTNPVERFLFQKRSFKNATTFPRKVVAIQVGGCRITNTTRDIIIYFIYLLI